MNVNKNFESHLISTLKKIDEFGPVDQLIYKNQYFWPLLKVKIYFDNWTLYNQAPSSTRTKPRLIVRMFNSLKYGMQFLLADFKNMQLPQKCDILFFADPFNRRVITQGKKFEIYLDAIAKKMDHLGHKTLIVERNAINQYHIPRYSKSIPQFVLQIFFAPYLLKKIGLSTEFQAALNQIKSELKMAGLSTAAIEDVQLRRSISIFELHFNLYCFLLRLCKPKYVVLTEWYSIISISLILACKKLQIKSVEVQHGVQSDAHIAYGNFMKKVSPKYTLAFPDIFWVWTQADKENIERFFSKYNCRAFVGGNLFLQDVVRSELILEGEEQLQFLHGQDKKICIVTLQPTYELHPLILKFIELNHHSYFFLIRLHPIMMGQFEVYYEKIKSLFPDLSFEMDLSTKLPLILLLKHSDLHITFNSSAVLEAEKLLVPSYIFDNDLAMTYFKEQIQSGICMLYETANKPFISNVTSINSEEPIDINKLFEI